MIDVEKVKQKILNFLNEKGPSLPMSIAKVIELSSVFASAILAEMLHEKTIKTSNMRIGSSPLYFIPGQENRLEKFESNMTGIEKEAFLKLRATKILDDEKQNPAIRVALRSIKDFAVQIKINQRVFWKYAFLSEDEFHESLRKMQNLSFEKEKEFEKEVFIEEKPEKLIKKTEKEKPIENIFQEKKKKSNSFLDEIKSFLENKGIEIKELREINKKEITAIVKIKESEVLLVAFNKKRINEKELLQVYKKAQKAGLNYYILTKEEQTKKMYDMINAYKTLLMIESLN